MSRSRLFIALVLCAVACSDADGPVGITSVQLEHPSAPIAIGASVQLSAVARDARGEVVENVDLRWSTGNASRAVVSAAGVLEALAAGDVKVMVAVVGPSDRLSKPVADTVVLDLRAIVARVEIQDPGSNFTTGDERSLEAVALDGAGVKMPGVEFEWESSDPSILHVTMDGRMRARSLGAARIGVRAVGPSEFVGLPVGATILRSVDRIVFTAIAAGGVHSCAVARGGAPHCWGEAAWGRLGIGVAYEPWFQIPRPTPVALDPSAIVSEVYAGREHDSRSGHSCALTIEAELLCWGSGEWGMLGDGQYSSPGARHTRPSPTRVGPARVMGVSLGGTHSCVISDDGGVHCAGSSYWGQSGPVTDALCPESCSPNFTLVSGDRSFSRLAVGALHSCALEPNGAAWCWGFGTMGALGAGEDEVGPRTTTPVPVSGELSFTQIASGSFHSCGLTADGVVHCWGQGDFGELGLGASSLLEFTPSVVSSAPEFAVLRAGGQHTCALTGEGAAYCWGLNEHGQLGASTSETCASGSVTWTCSTVPLPVSTAVRFVDLSLGTRHSCGIVSSGEVYCWGDNSQGQLGTGEAVQGQILPPSKVLDGD